MDDDLIRRALGAGVDSPSPELLARAVAAGTARRRRRVAAVTAAATLFVGGVAGTLVVSQDGDEEIVGVAPTTTVDVTSTTTGAAATTAPITAPATIASPTTAPTTTAVPPPVETLPSDVPGGTSAPFVAQPQPVCDPVPELTADRITVSIVGVAPDRADGFLQERFADFRRTGIELWGPGGVVASIADTVPDNPDQFDCPTSLLPLRYDGRFVWLALGGTGGCRSCVQPARLRLFRVDAVTGEVTEAWSSSAGEQVLDVLPSGDGDVSVLTGPVYGGIGVIRWTPSGAQSRSGGRVWPISAPLVDASVSLVGAGGRERTYVAYTTGGPSASPSTLHVVAVGEPDEEFDVDLNGVLINPVLSGIAPDGSGVLLLEDWEGIGTRVRVLLDGSIDVVGSGACWTSSGLLARSTWTLSSESIFDEPGTVELLQPDLSVVADLELNTFGGALACLSGDRVALSAFDAVPGSVAAGSERVVIVGDDGLVELGRDPDLRVVGRNAGD